MSTNQNVIRALTCPHNPRLPLLHTTRDRPSGERERGRLLERVWPCLDSIKTVTCTHRSRRSRSTSWIVLTATTWSALEEWEQSYWQIKVWNCTQPTSHLLGKGMRALSLFCVYTRYNERCLLSAFFIVTMGDKECVRRNSCVWI